MARSDSKPTIIHASCVAMRPQNGVLIVGASGSGKSSLALMMMSLGACLVADDRTQLTRSENGGGLVARAPANIQHLIEARGVGLLNAMAMEECTIQAVVDLDKQEDERLPPMRTRHLLGYDIPVYYRVDAPYFAAALVQLLKEGRYA